MSWLGKQNEDGIVRFQDLPEETQEHIVRCFDKGLVPDLDLPEMTNETLIQWYANRAILKFWVNHKHLRR
jgi:hypothetical protein